MKGVILAAGISSRLRPLTDATPKCLLPLGEKTILSRTLDALICNGVREMVIVTGYREDQIHAHVAATYPRLGVEFVTNHRYAETNNIVSLWLTRDRVSTDDMLLLDSDIIFADRILGLLLHSGRTNCLAVRSDRRLGAEEIKVRVSRERDIVEIGKEVAPARALGESIGIERFSGEFLAQLFEVLERKVVREGRVQEFYEAAFQEVISAGERVAAIDVGTLPCIEIDTQEDLERARTEIIPLLDRDRSNRLKTQRP